jgi:hypothetical protein
VGLQDLKSLIASFPCFLVQATQPNPIQPNPIHPPQFAAKSGGAFRTPPGCCVPFGVMELTVATSAPAQRQRYEALLAAAEAAPVAELDGVCGELQVGRGRWPRFERPAWLHVVFAAAEPTPTNNQQTNKPVITPQALIKSLQVPDAVLRSLAKAFPPGTPLICRSSANVEDLEGMSGAGLYDSIPNVPSDSVADISAAVTAVWASLQTRRAVLSRRAAGVKQAEACMAVLVQAMLAPQLSFVLHTASPLGDDPGTAVAEVAVGLGETLASGARGSAWRLAVDKASGAVTTLAFANFATALVPAPAAAPQLVAAAGGGGSAGGGSSAGVLHESGVRLLDYSQQVLSRSADARKQLGGKLGAVAGLLEEEFGGPQDVEGCLVGDAVFVVQTRPQPI